MIIGLVGLIGSGKDTAADYLVNFHQFRRDSFAAPLKDAVAAVFGWDRELLEGRSKQSREWREQGDIWWSNRLGRHITPRGMLQEWGTEVCRNSFHPDIWVASMEDRLRRTTVSVVITDVRFPNEIWAIKQAGGFIIQINRGPLPSWWDTAVTWNRGDNFGQIPSESWGLPHASEWSWVGNYFIDEVVDNNGSIEDLYNKLNNTIDTISKFNYNDVLDNKEYEHENQ